MTSDKVVSSLLVEDRLYVAKEGVVVPKSNVQDRTQECPPSYNVASDDHIKRQGVNLLL